MKLLRFLPVILSLILAVLSVNVQLGHADGRIAISNEIVGSASNVASLTVGSMTAVAGNFFVALVMTLHASSCTFTIAGVADRFGNAFTPANSQRFNTKGDILDYAVFTARVTTGGSDDFFGVSLGCFAFGVSLAVYQYSGVKNLGSTPVGIFGSSVTSVTCPITTSAKFAWVVGQVYTNSNSTTSYASGQRDTLTDNGNTGFYHAFYGNMENVRVGLNNYVMNGATADYACLVVELDPAKR